MVSLRGVLPLLPLLFALPGLQAQPGPANPGEIDPVSLIGATLDELVRGFGAPRSAYPSRGLEEWQDDVVFVYSQGDFYIHKDWVWQLGLRAARGIKVGDSIASVSLVLGSRGALQGNSFFCPLDEGAWPLMLRCDFDNAGTVLNIFVYRTDF